MSERGREREREREHALWIHMQKQEARSKKNNKKYKRNKSTSPRTGFLLTLRSQTTSRPSRPSVTSAFAAPRYRMLVMRDLQMGQTQARRQTQTGKADRFRVAAKWLQNGQGEA